MTAGPSDSPAILAAQYLGDAAKSWVIEDFNNRSSFAPGQEVVIPLKPPNPAGIYESGYQAIPILCYHRFGAEKSRMTVTPEDFARQMTYLAQHDFRVIRMADLADFLRGKSALPKRAVVISFDDGYKSVYQHAWPVLRRLRIPATIFVYSDFIGARDALSWGEMQEMASTGLIDIQPHSKSHANLGVLLPEEDRQSYQQRLYAETRIPAQEIVKNLGRPMHTFAFPYGDTNKNVTEILKRDGYRLAATVQPGSNAAFSNPYMLQRNMVFGDFSLDDFARLLDTFHEVTPAVSETNLTTPPDHEKLALHLSEQGQLADALVHWKILRTLNPQNHLAEDMIRRTSERITILANQHRLEAQAAEDRGDLAAARHELLRALALDPRHSEAMEHIRRLESDRVWRVMSAKLGRLRDAEERKTAAAEQEHEYLELGIVLMQRGDNSGALREIQKYLNTYPNDMVARAMHAEASRRAALHKDSN